MKNKTKKGRTRKAGREEDKVDRRRKQVQQKKKKKIGEKEFIRVGKTERSRAPNRDGPPYSGGAPLLQARISFSAAAVPEPGAARAAGARACLLMHGRRRVPCCDLPHAIYRCLLCCRACGARARARRTCGAVPHTHMIQGCWLAVMVRLHFVCPAMLTDFSCQPLTPLSLIYLSLSLPLSHLSLSLSQFLNSPPRPLSYLSLSLSLSIS